MKTMKLFTASWCQYCQPVKQMVLDKNLNIEIVDIDDQVDLAINYNVQQIPALAIEQDTMLLESQEIMRYLETL